MANCECVFQRVEKKYILDKQVLEDFLMAVEPHLQADQYGMHTICNIYYDTSSFLLVRSSIEKPQYKEKLRLRSYGVPSAEDTVFIEIKKKYRDVVFKRRVPVTAKQAADYLDYGVPTGINSQIMGEIDYFMQFYRPEPKVFLAYDRVAYAGKTDDVRITVDRGIRSREVDLDISMGDYGSYLLPKSHCLVEIKVPSAYPLWLTEALSKYRMYPVSFSKYGNVYKQKILNFKGEQVCLQAL